MHRTEFINDFFAIGLAPGLRGIPAVASIRFVDHRHQYRVTFCRKASAASASNRSNWEASTTYLKVIDGIQYELPTWASGRTQMAAAKALARELGLILYQRDFDAEQAAHDREALRDPGAPCIYAQARECDAEHEARLLDRD